MGLHIFRKTPCCVGVFLCLGVRSSSTVAALVASVQVDMSAKNPGNNIQTRLEYKYQGCQLSLSAKNGRTGPVLRIVNKHIIYLCLESLRYTYLVAKKNDFPSSSSWNAATTRATMANSCSYAWHFFWNLCDTKTYQASMLFCMDACMHVCAILLSLLSISYTHVILCMYIYISIYIYISVCVYVHIYLMCPLYYSHAYSDWDRLLCSKERTILRISSGAAVVTGRSAQ